MCSILCGIGLALSAGSLSLTASATTVSDVIAHAYAVGLPESTIQQCINQYSGGEYTSEQCDAAIAQLDAWAAQRDEAIEEVLSEDSTEDAESTTEETETTTEAAATTEEVTEQEFIKMSLDEKTSYVNSLSDEDREEFIANMSNDVRNSFLKQLDTDAQLEIIASLADVGDTFGVSFSVDTISDDDIAISARDADGNLVDVTTFGNTVEETGIPYTKPICIGVGAILLAVVGLGVVLRFVTRKTDK